MTTFSQIVTVLGAVGGIAVLAVMAGGPLLLDLSELRSRPVPRRPMPRDGGAPAIPQQRRPSEPTADTRVGPRL